MIKGTLIKESLLDESILDLINIESTEIWRADNHTANQPLYWTAIFFYTNSDDFIDTLSKSLMEDWYVDLSNDTKKILVFKDKVIAYAFGDVKGKQAAIDYCNKIGIPESQIDWNDDN